MHQEFCVHACHVVAARGVLIAEPVQLFYFIRAASDPSTMKANSSKVTFVVLVIFRKTPICSWQTFGESHYVACVGKSFFSRNS